MDRSILQNKTAQHALAVCEKTEDRFEFFFKIEPAQVEDGEESRCPQPFYSFERERLKFRSGF